MNNKAKYTCTDQSYCIASASHIGPAFGAGNDIYINNNSNNNNNSFCLFPSSYGLG